MLNRKTCEGQIEGALSMGLGQAVFEEIMTNDQGRVINGNFRDYKVPTFMDNPNNEHVHVDFVGDPFETGPNGAKGVGEVALIPVMAAVANAINAATGAEIHNIPMTRERVLQALRDQGSCRKEGSGIMSKNADFLVLGGGMIGCATAYYLSRGGASVTVLERGDTAFGTARGVRRTGELDHLRAEPDGSFHAQPGHAGKPPAGAGGRL